MNARQRAQRRRLLRSTGLLTLTELRELEEKNGTGTGTALVEPPSAFDAFLPPAPTRSVDWPEPLPPTLSPTSVTTFLTCPEQWRRVYLCGERSRCSGALLIGRADSKAAEVDLGQKITSGVNMDVEAVKDVAADSFAAEMEEEGGQLEILWDDGETPGSAKDMAVACASAYRLQRAEYVQPLAVEERVELAIPGIVPTIAGYLDVREPHAARERKTSNRRMSKPGNQWMTQTLLYAAATRLPTRFDVTVKNARPEVLPEMDGPNGTTPFAQHKLNQVVSTVAESIVGLLNSRGPDHLWPGTAAVQMVSACSWCSLSSTCPFPA